MGALPTHSERSDDLNTANVPMQSLADAHELLQRGNPDRLDRDINTVLQLVGRGFGADRAYLFQMKDMLFVQNTHEWTAPGATSVQADLQETPYHIGEMLWSAFRKHRVFLMHDAKTIAAGSDFHKMVVQQDIKSMFAAPLWSGNEISGLVGLDYCKSARRFSAADSAALRSLAASLGLALQRRDVEKKCNHLTAEVQAVNDKMSSMVLALPELLIETDQEGIVVGFYQRPSLIFALSPDEVIGLPPEAFLPAHVARIVRKAMAQVDAEEWSQTFSYSIEIDGQRKRFTLHATRRGKRYLARSRGYLFFVRDITETYHQSNRMHLLAQAAELSSNLVMLTDEEQRITWMNPATVARTGMSLDAAMGQHPCDILRLSEVTGSPVDDMRSRLEMTGQVNKDMAALSWTGLPYWIDLNFQPLRDAEGEIQGYMAVAYDVSAHKLANARALREHAHAMEMSEDAIAISHPDGRFSYMNPALRRVLNIPADASVETLTWASINPPSVNERFTSIIPDLYAHGQWSGEIAFPQDNAPDRYFDLSIWVQDDGCFLSIARETTARKAAEKHNALLREQLQIAQSRQQFAQLAGGLAHDINNYIAVIMHGVDALKSEASPNVIDSIERMETATRQVLSLAQNMCKLGSRATERIRTEIRPIVRQATDLLRPSLGGDATLSLNLPDEAMYIQCDPTEIMQALLNLLINARDALPDDPSADRRIEVKISEFHLSENIIDADVGTICRQKRYTRIEIRDTGMGLDDYVKARIFDPYFTTKGERGTGLGMSIVSRILVANHAALRICSEPGEGTSMQVYWPIASDTEQGLQPAVLSADQRNELLDGMTILLVDPDDTCLDEVADLLTAAGAEVVSCLNAEDAIESLSEDPFLCDVVVFNAKKGMAEAKELKETVLHSASGVQMVLTIDEKKSHFAIDEVQNENMSILQQPLSESLLVEALHRAKLRIKNKG